jgi:flagellar motor switch protein FliN
MTAASAADDAVLDDAAETETRLAGGKARAIYRVPVQVQVVLGRTWMPMTQLLKLGRGAVVELDRKVGEPVEVLVNGRLVARGEIVIVEDQRLGVTLSEIVQTETGQA